MPVGLSEPELTAWGEAVGAAARGPLVIVLRGDLGAGKTTLARSIARGVGVAGPIPSPTYNLLFRYSGTRGREVVHIDLYRLEDREEVWALGWAELPGPDDIVLIEWGERAEDLLPTPRWEIRLDEVEDASMRSVDVRPIGEPPRIPELEEVARGEP